MNFQTCVTEASRHLPPPSNFSRGAVISVHAQLHADSLRPGAPARFLIEVIASVKLPGSGLEPRRFTFTHDGKSLFMGDCLSRSIPVCGTTDVEDVPNWPEAREAIDACVEEIAAGVNGGQHA